MNEEHEERLRAESEAASRRDRVNKARWTSRTALTISAKNRDYENMTCEASTYKRRMDDVKAELTVEREKGHIGSTHQIGISETLEMEQTKTRGPQDKLDERMDDYENAKAKINKVEVELTNTKKTLIGYRKNDYRQ